MRRALIAGFLLLWATQAAAEPSGRISAVKFRGNQRVTDAALAELVVTKRAADYDPDTVAADIEALWSTSAFNDVQVEARKARRGLHVTFVVVERPFIRAVRFTGVQGALASIASNVITMRKDSYFDAAVAKRDVDELRAAFRDEGYWHADASIEPADANNRGEVEARIDIRPGPLVLIRKLEFKGNKAVNDKQLRALVANGTANTKGAIFNPTWFRADLQRITSYYFDRGRIDVRVKDPIVTESKDGLSLDVSVTIEEGARYKLSKLEITGDLIEKKKHYRKLCRSKVGAVFHRTNFVNDIQRIRNDYNKAGYKHAYVTPLTKIDMKKHTVEVTLEITKGSP